MECWGDAVGFDGTQTIAQPLIEPLFNGKSAIELLALLIGSGPYDGYEIVRGTMGGDEARWRESVHAGIVAGSTWAAVQPALQLGAIGAELSRAAEAVAETEVRFLTHGSLYDGRWANNGWLIEMPDPVTKLCWDNAALIAPATADALGVKDGQFIDVTVDGRASRCRPSSFRARRPVRSRCSSATAALRPVRSATAPVSTSIRCASRVR